MLFFGSLFSEEQDLRLAEVLSILGLMLGYVPHAENILPTFGGILKMLLDGEEIR